MAVGARTTCTFTLRFLSLGMRKLNVKRPNINSISFIDLLEDTQNLGIYDKIDEYGLMISGRKRRHRCPYAIGSMRNKKTE